MFVGSCDKVADLIGLKHDIACALRRCQERQ